MEGFSLIQGPLYGNGATIKDLCKSLESSLLLRPRAAPENERVNFHRRSLNAIRARNNGSRIRPQETAKSSQYAQKKLVSKCETVSTISEKKSVFNGKDAVLKWRLDGEIERLRDLQLKLQVSKTVTEKIAVLDRNARVQAVFSLGEDNRYFYPLIELSMQELSEYQVYLLKCLVAIGQEHVLDLWDGKHNGCSTIVPEKNFLKDAFYFMAQLIDSWEDVMSLQSSKALPWPSAASNFDFITALQQRKRKQEELQPERRGILQHLKKFVQLLDAVEKFYDCVGGIAGYQLAALELIRSSEIGERSLPDKQDACETFCHVPDGRDLSKDTVFATQAAGWGVTRLPDMGEIYPLGGAGDRLGLVDDATGECLPVAMLPYCGRTLLEGLIRDLQAREFLHFKVYGTQVITPVAIMTSAAKQNNKRVQALCESHGWFGRGRKQFQLFEQPLVPTVAAENGHWVISGPLDLVLKPGGHGVIWKLAKDLGIFKWFYRKDRKAAIVRQISNPVAGTDVTLLALSGVGLQQKKKFGFASCERNVGAAEGVNVLMESKTVDGLWRYGTTCIEYTEFSRLGIADVPVSTGSMQAKLPANTNVLFVDLKSVEQAVSCNRFASLPGIIMNLKKPVKYTDCDGVDQSIRAGRVECTMQNIADSLQNHYRHRLAPINHENLDTYIIFNQRRKVTSSAKRRRKLGDQSLHQTPDGSFLDITRNAFDLLTSCGVEIAAMDGNHCYIETGPPFLVLLHPALGPLWNIIRQKIQGGSVGEGSEVQLEIAELAWKDVNVDGSLLVKAENVMGSCRAGDDGENILTYGEGCGKCRLERVQVVNQGVDWNCPSNVYWQNKVKRHESLQIVLKGRSEFDASDVVLKGSHVFEVPDGYRMLVRSSDTGFSCTLEPLSISASWTWDYTMQDNGQVQLKMVEMCKADAA